MIVRLIIVVVAGGPAKYGVYSFIGCSSKTCPITTDPWMSTGFGMVFGSLLSRAI